MAKCPEVAITDKTNNVDTISLDDEKDVVKTENIQLELSSITEEPSREDILKIYEPSTNQRVISLDTGEKAIELNVIHILSPEVNPSDGIEKWEPNVYREKSSKYTCPISVGMDKQSIYLNMKRLPSASRAYGTSREGSHLMPPGVSGGDYPFFRNKNAISIVGNEMGITPKVTQIASPFSLERKGNNRRDTTKIQIEDDCYPYHYSLDNEEGIKDNVSTISTESNVTTVSTLRDAFLVPSWKDRTAGRIIETGPIRTHWRTTGFYRNCPQTFITKHARLKRRDWTNTGFVVIGLYVFGFLCLGYAVFNSVLVNPIIIIVGVVLVSLASAILYLIYAIEKNRSLYTLSSGERRKVTFSNPFPAVH